MIDPGSVEAKTIRDYAVKDCPFCGGKAELMQYGYLYRVKCTKCEVSTMPVYMAGIAADTWNRRVKE